jgi:hypothetical protein
MGISIAVLVVLLAGSTYFGKQKYDSMLKAASQGLNFGEAYGKMINQSNCMLGLKVKYSSCSTMECDSISITLMQ